jgi:hypothetical protein
MVVPSSALAMSARIISATTAGLVLDEQSLSELLAELFGQFTAGDVGRIAGRHADKHPDRALRRAGGLRVTGAAHSGRQQSAHYHHEECAAVEHGSLLVKRHAESLALRGFGEQGHSWNTRRENSS